MARESARGTANLTLTAPAAPTRVKSARGTANLTLTAPTGPSYGPSKRGTANLTLTAPVPPPVHVWVSGAWRTGVMYVRSGGVWRQTF